MPVLVRTPTKSKCIGTAFAIGADILVTAGHVVEEYERIARREPGSRLRVLYVGNNFRRWPQSTTKLVRVHHYERAGHHDLAILQVEQPEPVNNEHLILGRMILSPGLPAIGTATRTHRYSQVTVDIYDNDDASTAVDINFRYNIADGLIKELAPNGLGQLYGDM
jgi:hypothetical protein